MLLPASLAILGIASTAASRWAGQESNLRPLLVLELDAVALHPRMDRRVRLGAMLAPAGGGALAAVRLLDLERPTSAAASCPSS